MSAVLAVRLDSDGDVLLTGPAELEFAGSFDPATGAWTRAQQDVA